MDQIAVHQLQLTIWSTQPTYSVPGTIEKANLTYYHLTTYSGAAYSE